MGAKASQSEGGSLPFSQSSASGTGTRWRAAVAWSAERGLFLFKARTSSLSAGSANADLCYSLKVTESFWLVVGFSKKRASLPSCA